MVTALLALGMAACTGVQAEPLAPESSGDSAGAPGALEEAANPLLSFDAALCSSTAPRTVPPNDEVARIVTATTLRVEEAICDARVPPGVNVPNGDLQRFPDKCGTYTKGLPHDAFGRVNPAAFATLAKALKTGRFADFERIILGGIRTLNNPLAGLAYDLEGLDPAQFGAPLVPPPPTTMSDQNATELLEHYWASLLRDVPFADYPANPLAIQAAQELGSLPTYLGPRTPGGAVTPRLLFRGNFPGETLGPYLSQFAVQPTFLGSQPIGQQQVTFVPGMDFDTTYADWLTVQNGNLPAAQIQFDPVLRFRRDGRDLAAWTRADVLYQEYLTAALVLFSNNAPYNPGNPYVHSRTQNGFATFGQADVTATLAEVAPRALDAVWYQKWFVHLRPRPEHDGGLVHLIKTGQADRTDCRFSNVILNSQGLQQSFERYGTYLLSQAFPEASPVHPAYPTGHGTVAGACITVLKFFFDGTFVLPNPVMPSDDGLALVPYTGPDAGQLTVNGELNKLGHNVSFGHGLHAGIHWRSDTDISLLLGEAVALEFLRDRARTYPEPFTIRLQKFDGTMVTISNQ
jgi:hypothetical protein